MTRVFSTMTLLGYGLSLGCAVEQVELRPGSSLTPAGVEVPSTGGPVGARADSGAALATGSEGSEAPSNPALDPGSNGGSFGASPPPPVEKGCTKVDFLFIVDNSLTMLFKQSNLRSSFPGFMRVVEENVEASDFHIMVVDTDGPNGDDATTSADGCNQTLGAGKRLDFSGDECGVLGDARFLSPGQPELEQTFSCIAKVGTFGVANEQPMDAMLQAISAQNGPGGCNEGFLREDAILVVTLITDSDDRASIGNPETWRAALIALKGGDEGAVVVLGLVGDNNLDEPLPGGPCGFLGLAVGAPNLQAFVQSLQQGSLASVCADDYSPFFAEAVSSIDTACDEFVPPVIQ